MHAPTIISLNSHTQGLLTCEGDCIIYGHVEGDIFTKESVMVEEGGFVKGTIQAPNLIVHGRVEGKVLCDRVKILPNGFIEGAVECHLFIMLPKALFAGQRALVAPLFPQTSSTLEFDTENILL